MVAEIREAPGMNPFSATPRSGRRENRRAPRELPKTRENVHAYVQAIANRHIENERSVRAWRFAKRVMYLSALIGAYLFYYFIDKLIEAMSLPSIGF